MAQPQDTTTQRGHFVHTNGVKMYYEVHGQGEPPLLIHGGTVTTDWWQPYLSGFAKHYRVITPDTCGHGRSDNPTGTMSYRLLADDMAAFVQVLDLHKPLIAGYSDGGQIALEIGMRYPDLAQALIVGGAWFKFTSTYREWLRNVVGDEESLEADTERFARNYPDWAARLQQIYGPDNWKRLLSQIKPMWATPLNYNADDFAQVIAPTLVLLGDRDESIPLEEAVEMYRLLPTAELAVIPDSNHGAFSSTKVASFQSVMLDFVTRHSISAGQESTSLRYDTTAGQFVQNWQTPKQLDATA